MPNKQQTFLLG